MRRIEPYFPLPQGVSRVDDRRVLSEVIFVIRNSLGWGDVPVGHGPHKTIYNRFIRWSRLGVFNRILHHNFFSAIAAAVIFWLRSMNPESSVRALPGSSGEYLPAASPPPVTACLRVAPAPVPSQLWMAPA